MVNRSKEKGNRAELAVLKDFLSTKLWSSGFTSRNASKRQDDHYKNDLVLEDGPDVAIQIKAVKQPNMLKAFEEVKHINKNRPSILIHIKDTRATAVVYICYKDLLKLIKPEDDLVLKIDYKTFLTCLMKRALQ